MNNEFINVESKRWVDWSMSIEDAIVILRKKWIQQWHLFWEKDNPLIIKKFFTKSKYKHTRHITVAYPYDDERTKKERYAGFNVSEDEHPQTFRRCLANLKTY